MIYLSKGGPVPIRTIRGSTPGVDRRSLESNKTFFPLFFFMYVYILWQYIAPQQQDQKTVFSIVEFEFVDMFYSKFQLVSTFSICS